MKYPCLECIVQSICTQEKCSLLEDFLKYALENMTLMATEDLPFYIRRILEEVHSEIKKEDVTLVYTDRRLLLRISVDMNKEGIEAIKINKLIAYYDYGRNN